MGVGIGCMWKGICRGHRIEPFWRGIPTPVIYLKNHTRAVIARHFFSGLSTRAEGPAVALHHLFQVWAVPSGFKNPGVESAG